MNWQNQKILIAGLGGTGVSMIAYLRQNGAEVAAYDANLKPEREAQLTQQFAGLKCYTGSLKDALEQGFDMLALSPGDVIPLDTPINKYLEINVGDRPRFEGQVGTIGSRLAIQITSLLSADRAA